MPEIDMETCSWCVREVPYSTLTAANDGALVCRICKSDEREGRL